ncbi:MAG: hypothetical protein ACTSQJ_13140 [Promethearchaeota archaeon]
MSQISPELKKQFLLDFQTKIVQGRKLLKSGNHRWGDKLLTQLYYDIEKSEWLDIQKKRQLTMIISNSWWIYINSLVEHKEGEIHIDLIKYIDAYKRFFSFLSKLDDFYQFTNFFINLLKTFIEMENLSQAGITKFINSFSFQLREKKEYLKLIELQILLMYLRKSVIPTDIFHKSMEFLGDIISKLEPGKRALFLYIFIENINIKYQLMENSQEFVQLIHKLLINRLSSYLKQVFSDLRKISFNERNFEMVLSDLEELIYYLNNIGEYPWIIVIIRNLYMKFQQFRSFGDAIVYIRHFIDFAIKRNRFEIAFEIYDFLEDLFMYQTDLGYDNILIELWVEACKKFSDMKEKKFLLQSLEKLNNHLKTPQKNAQIYHFFYTCNYLWKFKGCFFSLEDKDFWRMMFYRALFEENDIQLAGKLIPYLDKMIRRSLTDLDSLVKIGETLKHEIYSFETESEKNLIIDSNFVIKQMIIRINFKGLISYRMISLHNQIVEGYVQNEFWNDAQIIEIYNELFSDKEEKKYNFSLNEFGRLLYIFLPKIIRDLLKQIKIASLNLIPQIYIILDYMTFPFELIYDNNFFLLKYSSAYKIGEAPLGGVAFDHSIQEDLITAPTKEKYNVLIIDAINAMGPLKWNNEKQIKELIFPFEAGANELNYIANFFNNRAEINQINLLSGSNAGKNNIMLNLTEGAYHIIHFVGNVFYSKWSPKDSFFLTNDNEIVTFSEINNALDRNTSDLKPFLFFNTQIYDVDGKKLKNTLKTFGEIVSQFDYDKITGIISRNYPIFNSETKEIIKNFYINLFNKRSQGVALLKARQQVIAKKIMEHAEILQNIPEGGSQQITVKSSLAISSYILFGKPWKKL